MTMADEKRYFSVKDMFEQAVTRAKTDPRYEEYSKICELDYDLLCSTCKYDKLYRCEFDVVGEVTYGSSEVSTEISSCMATGPKSGMTRSKAAPASMCSRP